MQSACMMAIDENDVIGLVDRLLVEITSTEQADSKCAISYGAALSTASP
jgi:hypothetical protein